MSTPAKVSRTTFAPIIVRSSRLLSSQVHAKVGAADFEAVLPNPAARATIQSTERRLPSAEARV